MDSKVTTSTWKTKLSSSYSKNLVVHKGLEILEECQQHSLVEEIVKLQSEENGVNGVGIEDFCQQITQLNKDYPNGLLAYVTKARELLKNAQEGTNPFLQFKPEVPDGVKIDFGSSKFQEYETIGSLEVRNACFVLVAGGLGERLGYPGIKVSLPSELSSGVKYLELYFQFIYAFQNLGRSEGDVEVEIPVAIMTSDDTHKETLKLLNQFDYFGLKSTQVTVLKQDKVASIGNAAGDFVLETDTRGPTSKLSTKPHGHGDVHLLLHKHGIAQKWLGSGKKWVCFFQDTNAMAFRTLLAGLGVSNDFGFNVNFITVPRKAKADAGAIMKLRNPADGSSQTLNVEYNYIDDMLKHNGFADGDTNGPDGYSSYPGNTNQLVFTLAEYVQQLERTGGLVPEFVNPKYSDSTRTSFVKPTRLECMMQDYPQGLSDSDSVGVSIFGDLTEYPGLTHRLYCPVKNNIEVARSKAAKGIPSASAITGELTVYAANAGVLKTLGAKVQGPRALSLGGIDDWLWAKVVLLPRFCPRYADLPERFGGNLDNVSISNRSTLLLDGDVWFPNGLELDGTLKVRVPDGIRIVFDSASIQDGDAGECRFEDLTQEEELELPDYVKIRGCKLVESAVTHQVSFREEEIELIGVQVVKREVVDGLISYHVIV